MSYRGYDHLREDFDSLARESGEYAPICQEVKDLPESFDPRGWLRIENQGSWPSCGGHALSSVMEVVNYFATGGSVIQLSRMFAWVESQRIYGTPSPRDGITIDAAVKVSKKLGLPLEETVPYQVGDWKADYDESVYMEASKYRTLHSYAMKSYEDCLDFLRGGIGAIIIGIPWQFKRSAWHAVAYCGFLKDGTLLGPNSWGEDWGNDKGWFEHDKKTVERYLGTSGVVMFGISDMAAPKVRPYPWQERFFG